MYQINFVENKAVGRTAANPLQTVDFQYNVRGWLTDINNIDDYGNTDGDLFSFQLRYDNPAYGTPLFNGNISQAYWKTNSDSMIRKYSYNYDGLNRLLSAYYKNESNNVANTYNESLTYDKNGNIQSLQRNGGYESSTYLQAIDNLTYIYDPNNLNQLKKVVDLSNSPQGFKDDSNGSIATDLEDDYIYDENGNMILDQNKNITLIKYNHLNLPIEINLTNNRKINYTYDASGVKLKKEVSSNDFNLTITDYINGYQYKTENANNASSQSKLQFFPTAEGYVKAVYNNLEPTALPIYSYVYNYTDHLGNIRLSYTEQKGVATKIDEKHYYPNGYLHGKYNQAKKKLVIKEVASLKEVKTVPTIKNSYKYSFNSTEWQDEFDLNMYDLGARGHDPARVSFGSIDPRAEDYYSQSPYVFAANNPVYFVDINGEGVEDYFDEKTGEYLGRGGTDEIRFISIDNWLSNSLDCYETYDKSVGNTVEAKVFEYYNEKYNLTPKGADRVEYNDELHDSFTTGYKNIDGEEVLEFNFAEGSISNDIKNKYDAVNVLVHEIGTHGKDWLKYKKYDGRKPEVFWSWEKRALNAQINHWSWGKTSKNWKQSIYDNYGELINRFSNKQVYQYFGKYDVK